MPAESPTLGFTHLQFEALLTAARQSPNPCDFALVAMLGLLGLRIFEATGADIADLGEEHGHRVLRVCGKGTKVVLVPLPPAVGRAIDRAVGLRDRGPILLNSRGARMGRHAATRRLRRLAAPASRPSGRTRTCSATRSSRPVSTLASICAMSRSLPVTPFSRTGASHTDVVRTGRRERLAGERSFAAVSEEIFDGADLSSICLNRLWPDRCSLVAADLRHATLDRCRFRFCDPRRAGLRGASLRFALLIGCDLREADLRDCDLTGVRFGFVNTGAANGLTV